MSMPLSVFVGRQIGTAVPPGVGSHCAKGDLQAPAVQNGSIGCPPVSVAVRQAVRPMQSTMLAHEEYMPSSGCSLGGSPKVDSPPEEPRGSVSVEASAEVSPVDSAVSVGSSVSPEPPVESDAVVDVAVVGVAVVAVAEPELIGAKVVAALVAGSSPDAHPSQTPASSHPHRFTPRVWTGGRGNSKLPEGYHPAKEQTAEPRPSAVTQVSPLHTSPLAQAFALAQDSPSSGRSMQYPAGQKPDSH